MLVSCYQYYNTNCNNLENDLRKTIDSYIRSHINDNDIIACSSIDLTILGFKKSSELISVFESFIKEWVSLLEGKDGKDIIIHTTEFNSLNSIISYLYIVKGRKTGVSSIKRSVNCYDFGHLLNHSNILKCHNSSSSLPSKDSDLELKQIKGYLDRRKKSFLNNSQNKMHRSSVENDNLKSPEQLSDNNLEQYLHTSYLDKLKNQLKLIQAYHPQDNLEKLIASCKEGKLNFWQSNYLEEFKNLIGKYESIQRKLTQNQGDLDLYIASINRSSVGEGKLLEQITAIEIKLDEYIASEELLNFINKKLNSSSTIIEKLFSFIKSDGDFSQFAAGIDHSKLEAYFNQYKFDQTKYQSDLVEFDNAKLEREKYNQDTQYPSDLFPLDSLNKPDLLKVNLEYQQKKLEEDLNYYIEPLKVILKEENIKNNNDLSQEAIDTIIEANLSILMVKDSKGKDRINNQDNTTSLEKRNVVSLALSNLLMSPQNFSVNSFFAPTKLLIVFVDIHNAINGTILNNLVSGLFLTRAFDNILVLNSINYQVDKISIGNSSVITKKLDENDQLMQDYTLIWGDNFTASSKSFSFVKGELLIGKLLETKSYLGATEFYKRTGGRNFNPQLLKKIKEQYEHHFLLVDHTSTKEELLNAQSQRFGLLYDTEILYAYLCKYLRSYVEKSKCKKVIIGLSGGIDSALIAQIAVDTLGEEAVHLVFMPTQFTSHLSYEVVSGFITKSSCRFSVIDIDKLLKVPIDSYSENHNNYVSSYANLSARTRAMSLMYISNMEKSSIVLNTSNKSEIAVGYSTLHGDSIGAISLLKDLYKTDVYKLAHWRRSLKPGFYGTPLLYSDTVLDRKPSAELFDNQYDSDDLPPYEELDPLLFFMLDLNLDQKTLLNKLAYSNEIVEKISLLMHNNRHKLNSVPSGLRIQYPGILYDEI